MPPKPLGFPEDLKKPCICTAFSLFINNGIQRFQHPGVAAWIDQHKTQAKTRYIPINGFINRFGQIIRPVAVVKVDKQLFFIQQQLLPRTCLVDGNIRPFLYRLQAAFIAVVFKVGKQFAVQFLLRGIFMAGAQQGHKRRQHQRKQPFLPTFHHSQTFLCVSCSPVVE